MNLIYKFAALSSLTVLVACGKAPIQDTPKAREELTEQYFQLVPMKQMMNDVAVQVAASMPEDKRDDFVAFLTKEVRLDVVEKSAKESFAKHMTTGEIEAYIEFMKKPEGQSAMNKMKFYLADVMPVIQTEVMTAVAKRIQHPE